VDQENRQVVREEGGRRGGKENQRGWPWNLPPIMRLCYSALYPETASIHRPLGPVPKVASSIKRPLSLAHLMIMH
jgi:hypothetical protein